MPIERHSRFTRPYVSLSLFRHFPVGCRLSLLPSSSMSNPKKVDGITDKRDILRPAHWIGPLCNRFSISPMEKTGRNNRRNTVRLHMCPSQWGTGLMLSALSAWLTGVAIKRSVLFRLRGQQPLVNRLIKAKARPVYN